MKPKLIFLCVFAIFAVNSYSTILEINQDGTGNFTTIQEGIDASANSDTVLVYPGTYFENLVINSKHLILGSLYLTTGDESYISQTILDGFQNECVLRIENIPGYYQMQILGFVIQHGIGFQHGNDQDRVGGGLYIEDSYICIMNCFIQYNEANEAGGGIALNNSVIQLAGTTIRYNQSEYAGGILIGYQSSSVYFDSDNLNNIYLNYAGVGNDIFKTDGSPFQEIIVDTFTVSDPSEGYYFIYPGSGGAGVPFPDQFSFSCQNSVIEQAEHDLYVSPDGDDNNSGISENDPLKTIAFALVKIHSDSLLQKTIYITDGIYSRSQNDQIFPIHLKSYVDIVGESRENTILDAELNGGFIIGHDPQVNYKIENFTFINARNKDDLSITQNSQVQLNNILVSNHIDYNEAFRALRFDFNDVSLNEIMIKNNQFQGSVYFFSQNNENQFDIVNCKFINNEPSLNGSIQLSCYFHTGIYDSLSVNATNIVISDNLSISTDWPPDTSAILITLGTKFNLINSTISNNRTLELGAAIQLQDESEINILNSIIYGNLPYQICLNGQWGPNTLNANNSLIEGGPNNQLIIDNNYINWDDDTMLDEDPLWLGSGYEYPYALSSNSPCIDTGTLELPYGVELPAYDLAGNPRVMGSNIDMGAYEFPGNAAPIYLVIDNETLSWQMPAGFSPTAYKVYLDDEFQSTITPFLNEYTFIGLIIGDTYKAGVSALYGTEETAIIPKYFTYNPVGIEESTHLSPLSSHLSNYPNPFNPSTTIKLELAKTGKIELAIYNIKGQKVKTLMDCTTVPGTYECDWNGKDEMGKSVSSGQYVVKLKQNGNETAAKIMLLK